LGEILKVAKSVLVIDHHKTATDVLSTFDKDPKLNYVLEIGKAGCELTWQRFMGSNIPRGVHLLGRYDVWDHSDPETLCWQYGMRGENTDPQNPASMDLWGKVLQDWPSCRDILVRGATLIDYERKQNSLAMNCAFEGKLFGYRCICVNKIGINFLAFSSVWDTDKYDIAVAFGYTGEQWKFTLFTDKDIDVSAIAKRFGGGGHAKASGMHFKSFNDIPTSLIGGA